MKVPENRIKYYVLGFYLLLVAVWQGLFLAELIPDYLFPSPTQVAQRLWELGADNYLWPSLKATFQRMDIRQIKYARSMYDVVFSVKKDPSANDSLSIALS